MSEHIIDTFVRLLTKSAWFLMPDDKKNWAEAMICELAHIPQEEQIRFALGCLTSSISERFNHMLKTKDFLFAAPLAGCAFLAIICLVNGVELLQEDASLSAVLFLFAGVWSACFAAFLTRSKQAALYAAGTGLSLYFAVGAATLLGASGFGRSASFLSALALEGVILCAVTLGAIALPILWPKERA
jgi:hypothetical protein